MSKSILTFINENNSTNPNIVITQPTSLVAGSTVALQVSIGGNAEVVTPSFPTYVNKPLRLFFNGLILINDAISTVVFGINLNGGPVFTTGALKPPSSPGYISGLLDLFLDDQNNLSIFGNTTNCDGTFSNFSAATFGPINITFTGKLNAGSSTTATLEMYQVQLIDY